MPTYGLSLFSRATRRSWLVYAACCSDRLVVLMQPDSPIMKLWFDRTFLSLQKPYDFAKKNSDRDGQSKNIMSHHRPGRATKDYLPGLLLRNSPPPVWREIKISWFYVRLAILSSQLCNQYNTSSNLMHTNSKIFLVSDFTIHRTLLSIMIMIIAQSLYSKTPTFTHELRIILLTVITSLATPL